MAGLHRKHPPLALDHRRAVQQPRYGCAIQGSGHYQKAQVAAQQALGIDGQRQTQIGIKASLVKLIEDHTGDAGKLGVRQDHAREDTFGDHLDAGARGNPRLHPDPKADRLAYRLAQGCCHALGGSTRGEAARLQQDDPPITPPGLAEQFQRDHCGLASPGRRDKHGAGPSGQSRLQCGQGLVDRQHSCASIRKPTRPPVLGA